MHNKKIWSLSDSIEDLPNKIRFLYPEIKSYATSFLCDKHPHTKRSVCPFMPKAVSGNGVYFTFLDDMPLNVLCKQTEEIIDSYLQLKSKHPDNFSAIFIMFDQSFSVDQLLRIHRKCKIYSINSKVMIGATYPTNNAPSLHSEHYYPLRTQSPCLVLRDLTIHDLPFLVSGDYNLNQKISFLKVFIEAFSMNKNKMSTTKISAANRLIDKYYSRKKQLKRISSITVIMLLMVFILSLIHI